MPCPWYRGGLCTSPLLDKPTTDVTLLSRCLSNVEYSTCRFFKELNQSVSTREEGKEYGRPILIIHGLTKPLRSECKFFKLFTHESGNYLAACDILRRYLNLYEVDLCIKYWSECPFRKCGDLTTGASIP